MMQLRKIIGPLWFAGLVAVSPDLLAVPSAPAVDNPAPVLTETNDILAGPNAKQLFALGMIETGNNDRDIGGAGEVSRYQILPAVWKGYSRSSQYTDPDVSVQVARQHWIYLAKYFKQKTGRTPDDFDMYVLWNTRFGYYARKEFLQTGISRAEQGRAGRYVNLVNRKD